MLVICAYVGAMAGVTALCYLFRKRPEDTNVEGSVSNQEAVAGPGGGIPDIVVTPPVPEKSRTRGRGGLTPETQAKIKEVLDFVNTPSDELVMVKEVGSPRVRNPSPRLPTFRGKTMSELQQSKAKVEAWMSDLDKVEGSPTTKDKPTVSSVAKKSGHSERLARVREEMARRRVVVNTRVDAAKRRDGEKDEEKPAVRKKLSVTPEVEAGTSHRKEAAVVPNKRVPESSRKRPARAGLASSRQASTSSADTSEETRSTKKSSMPTDEEVIKQRPSRGRSAERQPRRDDSLNEVEARKRPRRPEPPKTETQRSKSQPQSKQMSSFELRMKYVPQGAKTRTPSPEEKKINKVARPPSKIPVMINSRARPPATKKKPPPVAPCTKSKKSIRITNVPPPPPPPLPPSVEQQTIMVENRPPSDSVQEPRRDTSKARVREDAVPTASYPELNIIGVRGSRSCNPSVVGAVQGEAEGTVATRGAKSGPLGARGPPLSVSKTVQLPEGLDDNVTVVFSLTVPRCANPGTNWSGHEDSDHVLPVDSEEVPPLPITGVPEDEGQASDKGGENTDDGDDEDEGNSSGET